jgi:hypothetical protein
MCCGAQHVLRSSGLSPGSDRARSGLVKYVDEQCCSLSCVVARRVWRCVQRRCMLLPAIVVRTPSMRSCHDVCRLIQFGMSDGNRCLSSCVVIFMWFSMGGAIMHTLS